LAIGVLIAFVAYFGSCVYANYFRADENELDIDLPDRKEARYSLVVKNTATVIMTDDYEVFGSEVGGRTYVVHNYWELVGTKFEYRVGDVVLHEQVFGEITVERRK
jgi:hypothetical protein